MDKTTGRLDFIGEDAIKIGGAYRFPMVFTNKATGLPLDLSTPAANERGAIATMRPLGNTSISYEIGVEFSSYEGTDGTIYLVFERTFTESLRKGTYEWDMRLDFSGNDIWYPLEGRILTKEGISRNPLS